MDSANTEGACEVSNYPSREYFMRNGINISEEIEKYLENLCSKDTDFVDPKLKRERQRLQDLLSSYKKLSEQLDKKCAEASKEGIHVPTREILARRAEIYALLHPELYKNRREEEKNKLIEKISSRRHFSEVDRVCPRDITPIHTVSDKRQLEKDRFCKLVASAPSRFHNVLGESNRRFSRVTRPPATPPSHVDVREREKDRLARIFATSAAFIRDPNLKKKILQRYKEASRPAQSVSFNLSSHPKSIEPDLRQSGQPVLPQEHPESKELSKSHQMVRIGEYSPLNKYSSPYHGRTVLGVGEHDAIGKRLTEERHQECTNYEDEHPMEHFGEHSPLNKYSSPYYGRTVVGVGEHDAVGKQLTEERHHECINYRDEHQMERVGEHSPLNKYSSPYFGRTVLGVGEHDAIGKELTEERHHECLNYRDKESPMKADKGVMASSPTGRRSVSSASTQTDEGLADINSPVPDRIKIVSSPREFTEFSPREKLLSDLYGYRPNSHAAQDEKIKRIAYAQALQEQIKEKKRLEEERKRLEKEEEELEERRYREQAERIQKEYDKERNLNLVTHRQAQEDLLRKRLAEINLEAKELKKKGQINRLSRKRDDSPDISTSYRPNLDSVHSFLQTHENGGRNLDGEIAGASSHAVLPEQLPESNFEEDWSRMIDLKGVDLLREHRSPKERLQLPPVVDTSAKVGRKIKPTERAATTSYVPSGSNDSSRRFQNDKKPSNGRPVSVEEMNTEDANSAVSPTLQRPRSPILPAIRTGSLLKKNSRLLDDKWKVPSEGVHDLERTIVEKEKILTQLGAFRRQLAQEHHKLEERIRGESS